jgi:hypothetical protein
MFSVLRLGFFFLELLFFFEDFFELVTEELLTSCVEDEVDVDIDEIDDCSEIKHEMVGDGTDFGEGKGEPPEGDCEDGGGRFFKVGGDEIGGDGVSCREDGDFGIGVGGAVFDLGEGGGGGGCCGGGLRNVTFVDDEMGEERFKGC